MPLATQIKRGGEALKLPWGDFHVAAMILAVCWDTGEGPFETNTPPTEVREDGELRPFSYPEEACPITPGDAFRIVMYPVIAATALNDGDYTLKGEHKFIDVTDGEVLELHAGDVLSAWRN